MRSDGRPARDIAGAAVLLEHRLVVVRSGRWRGGLGGKEEQVKVGQGKRRSGWRLQIESGEKGQMIGEKEDDDYTLCWYSRSPPR